MNLLDMPATALAAEVGAGRAAPTDVAEAARARVAELNPRMNAITVVNPALAEEARCVEERLAKGELLPLAGVPVIIKDNIWVRGLPITQGSRLFSGFIAPEDALAVERLRAAGAMILGIGTCSEFACKGVTDTPLHGITRNPVDPARTTGGSSGGPSAAVAARMAPLALGTDAGGSTRRPPAHVGVIGFKPTQDLVPYGPGFDEPVWGVSVICPIAREMSDIRLAMQVLADMPGGPPISGPVAMSQDFGLGQKLDADMLAAFERSRNTLRDEGFALVDAAPEWGGLDGGSVMPLQHAGLAALYGDTFATSPELFDPDLVVQIESGLALSGVMVARAHQASHRIGTILSDFLGRYDAIIIPTTPCAAWPVDQLAPRDIGGVACAPRDHAAFTPQANHAGCPAISIPCGTTIEGLPLGLQIIAAKGRDDALLDLAARIAPVLLEHELEKAL
jgi:aspartyl-tRNA(Asn)/glutamyl-tRNA(Gln) amidotransferase subunit A